MIRGRIAFDVSTCDDFKRLRSSTNSKIQLYCDAVSAAGDTIFAPAFTPSGCPFPSALSLFRTLAHTGDSVPLPAGSYVPKFESEAVTWLMPTHVTFMVHAAAAAAARGAARAIKQYCFRRIADGYIVRAVEAAPPLVPRPGSE